MKLILKEDVPNLGKAGDLGFSAVAHVGNLDNDTTCGHAAEVTIPFDKSCSGATPGRSDSSRVAARATTDNNYVSLVADPDVLGWLNDGSAFCHTPLQKRTSV